MGLLKAGHLGGNIIGGDPDTYYPNVWTFLIEKFNVKSVLDVGCGEGYSLNFFRNLNIQTFGIDGAESNIKKCIEMGHKGKVVDFTKEKFESNMTFDLGWCCELVEHVEEKFVQNIIDTFKLCKVIAMTHALPNQGGYHHVNCKDWNYWNDLMGKNNFKISKHLSRSTKQLDRNKKYWYRTGLIFYNQKFSV